MSCLAARWPISGTAIAVLSAVVCASLTVILHRLLQRFHDGLPNPDKNTFAKDRQRWR
jgi:hypothetical protein